MKNDDTVLIRQFERKIQMQSFLIAFELRRNYCSQLIEIAASSDGDITDSPLRLARFDSIVSGDVESSSAPPSIVRCLLAGRQILPDDVERYPARLDTSLIKPKGIIREICNLVHVMADQYHRAFRMTSDL